MKVYSEKKKKMEAVIYLKPVSFITALFTWLKDLKHFYTHQPLPTLVWQSNFVTFIHYILDQYQNCFTWRISGEPKRTGRGGWVALKMIMNL